MGLTLLSALRFLGLLVVHILIAVIGTAILDTGISRAIASHTMIAVFWKESVLSIVCATLIGFGLWRMWRTDAAKWTWVLPLLWFLFGLLAGAGRDIWGAHESILQQPSPQRMRDFFLFTIPLIRAVAYSVGAFVASRLYRTAVAPGP
jgi:hypothetical protein